MNTRIRANAIAIGIAKGLCLGLFALPGLAQESPPAAAPVAEASVPAPPSAAPLAVAPERNWRFGIALGYGSRSNPLIVNVGDVPPGSGEKEPRPVMMKELTWVLPRRTAQTSRSWVSEATKAEVWGTREPAMSIGGGTESDSVRIRLSIDWKKMASGSIWT